MGGMREGQGDGRLIVMNNDFINTRLGAGSSEANKQKNIKILIIGQLAITSKYITL